MVLILVVVLLVLLLGGLPVAPWGQWHSLGWYPSSVLLVLVVVVLLLAFSGRL